MLIVRKPNSHAGLALLSGFCSCENHSPKNGLLSTYCHPCGADEAVPSAPMAFCGGAQAIVVAPTDLGIDPSARPRHRRVASPPFNFSKVIDHA